MSLLRMNLHASALVSLAALMRALVLNHLPKRAFLALVDGAEE